MTSLSALLLISLTKAMGKKCRRTYYNFFFLPFVKHKKCEYYGGTSLTKTASPSPTVKRQLVIFRMNSLTWEVYFDPILGGRGSNFTFFPCFLERLSVSWGFVEQWRLPSRLVQLTWRELRDRCIDCTNSTTLSHFDEDIIAADSTGNIKIFQVIPLVTFICQSLSKF